MTRSSGHGSATAAISSPRWPDGAGGSPTEPALRPAPEPMRIEAALALHPLASGVCITGEITSCHVRLLSRIATPADEERWVARACRMDLRVFVPGRLTLNATLLTGRVAGKATTSSCVGKAELVMPRRLEDEVGSWELLREIRPEVSELLDGAPLPQGLVMVPRQEPRLHACAPGANQARQADPPWSGGDPAGLHACAPGANQARQADPPWSAGDPAGLPVSAPGTWPDERGRPESGADPIGLHLCASPGGTSGAGRLSRIDNAYGDATIPETIRCAGMRARQGWRPDGRTDSRIHRTTKLFDNQARAGQ